MIPASDLKSIVRYDAETGDLFWLPRVATSPHVKAWNTKHAGQKAFCTVTTFGYLQGYIHNRRYYAHRVAYALYHGHWPTGQIDHITGITSDNRIANLRDVTTQENQRNQRRSANNTSGATGVGWCKKSHKWRAQISIKKTTKQIGVFERFEDALAARKMAERELGFHQNHGKIVMPSDAERQTI